MRDAPRIMPTGFKVGDNTSLKTGSETTAVALGVPAEGAVAEPA